MAYWQISAGTGTREYHQNFLDMGMAFTGHDRPMRGLRVGDILLLKAGLQEIWAVGIVNVLGIDVDCAKGDPEHLLPVDKHWLLDFDGWRLINFCHVEWRQHPSKLPVATPAPLRRGAFSRLNNAENRQFADTALQTWQVVQGNGRSEAHSTSIDALIDRIPSNQLTTKRKEMLRSELSRLQKLAKVYYRQHWEDIREHETRTFLVIPLLLTLGWDESRIKIELGVPGKSERIDIACFGNPYYRDKEGRPNNQDCVLLIETKGFGHGLRYAPTQGSHYASQFENCKTVIVTNGYAYRAYRKETSDGTYEKEESCAYLNLLFMRDSSTLEGNSGTKQGILEMLLPPRSQSME